MPDPHIIGRPSYALIQRSSLGLILTPLAPLGNSTQFGQITLPSIQATQALRIVCAFLSAGDGTASGNITLRSLNLVLAGGSTGVQLRQWTAKINGVLVGADGIAVNVTDDEFVLGNDYAEQGGIAGNSVFLLLLADVSVAVAATPLSLAAEVLFELYNVQTLS